MNRISEMDWIGAEGEHDGLPMLLRIRVVPEGHFARIKYPHLLVSTWRFRTTEASGLPSEAQYETIEQYEQAVLDHLEESELGVLVIVRTCAGKVQYFQYVSDIEAATTFLTTKSTISDALELAADEANNWKEYDAASAALQTD